MDFSAGEREAIHRLIASRRDVRRFRPDPVADDVLVRLLTAAHHAPSVGLMQPWNFILVRDALLRRRIKTVFLEENERAARAYSGERAALYDSLKLEGIQEAPLNICVTCDRTRAGPDVLGRHTIIDTDLYSTCCAVQNLWLAARAEGVGVGWVSIIRNDAVRAILAIPEHIVPVAYLCVGYPEEFLPEPELQRRGWAQRLALEDVIYRDQWGTT
jgi:5,6-dimethylbenzimidazole synthase